MFWLIFSFGLLRVSAQPRIDQRAYFPPGLRFTLGVGTTTNYTDIKKNAFFNSSKPFNEWRAVGQAALEYELTEYLNIRGHLSYAQIAGARNNLKFQADLIEASTTFNINPLMLIYFYDGRQRWFPSIILGIGIAHYNSLLVDNQNNTVASRGFGQGGGIFGYVIEGVAIGGLGVSYALNEHWSIRLELANRWMGEDNLDSFISVDRSPYDFYNFTIFSVGYKFFRKIEPPFQRSLPTKRW